MKLILIGSGKWGQKYISTLSTLSIDLIVANRSNWKQLINQECPDGVIVATPPDSHIEIAQVALKQDIPVMIEKPLALSYNQATILQQYSAPILINNIHLFSTAYRHLKSLISPLEISQIISMGCNKGPNRDYSSLWDYGWHDLSMILDLTQEMPIQIDCQEIVRTHGSLFLIKLQFSNGLQTKSLVGNGGEKPIRNLKITHNGLVSIYDDKTINNHIPPLTNALHSFMDNLNSSNDLGLNLSLRVLQILEQCQAILINK